MLYKSSRIIKNPEISSEFYLVEIKNIFEKIPEKEKEEIKETEKNERINKIGEEKVLNFENKIEELQKEINILEEEIKNRQFLLKDIESKLSRVKEELRSSHQELKMTQENIDKIKNEAYTEGIEKGRLDGKKEVLEKYEILKKIIDEVLKEKEKIIMDSEKELVNLALEISKKIVKEEIRLNEDVVLNIARSALNKLVERESIEIKVNPEEVEKIKELEKEFPSYGIKKWEIIPDPQVEKGGCIVGSGNTYFDGRISSQIEEVEKIWGKRD